MAPARTRIGRQPSCSAASTSPIDDDSLCIAAPSHVRVLRHQRTPRNDSYQNNPALWGGAVNLGYLGPLLPSRGALPIMMNGALVGAMGGSGAPAQEDENAVAAALAAVGLQ